MVLFHIPVVPLCTAISEEKMKLQSRDSYQPSERGDHSKRCIRGGEVSMVEGSVFGAVVLDVLDRRVRIV